MANRIERVSLVSEFTAKGAQRYRQDVTTAGKATIGLGSIVKTAAASIAALFTIQAGANLIKSLATTAANFESTALSIEVFVGSAERAKEVVQDAIDFAVQTPFEQDEVINATKTLLAFGTQAEDVGGVLRSLGEAAAASNTSIANLSFVFGQVRAQGKAQLQDLYQFINAGVPIFELLADSMGRNVSEIRKLTSAGKITGDVLEAAFKKAASEGGRFEGALLKQSQTLNGMTSTLRDEISNIIREIGVALLPQFKALSQSALDFVRTLDPEKIKDFALGIINFVKAAIPLIATLARAAVIYGVLTLANRAYVSGLTLATIAQKAFNVAAKANPIGLIAGALAIALPALITFGKEMIGITKATEAAKKATDNLREAFFDEQTEMNKLIRVIKDHNSTAKERQAAYDTLNEKYPDILANYDLEKLALTDIVAIQGELSKAILARISIEQIGEVNRAFLKLVGDIQASDPLIATRGRSFGLATDAEKEAIKKRQVEIAAAGRDAQIKAIQDAARVAESTIPQGARVSDEEAAAFQVSKERAQELRVELERLSSDQLQAQLAISNELNKSSASVAFGVDAKKQLVQLSKDELKVIEQQKIEENQRRKTILEILAERKKTIVAPGTGELEAARGSLAALEAQLKLLEERINKTSRDSPLLEGLSNQAIDLDKKIRDVKDLLASLRDQEAFFTPKDSTTAEELLAPFLEQQAQLKDLQANRAQQREDETEAEERRIANLRTNIEDETTRNITGARRNLLKELQGIEANDFKARENAFIKFEDEILAIQIEALEKQKQVAIQAGDASALFTINDQILDARLQQNENAANRLKEQLTFADVIDAGILPVIQGISQVTQALEDAANRAYDIQQRRVEDARKLAERGNAELLQLEEERLRESEERQRRAAQTTRELAAIEFAASAAVAIAKAAATSGPLALALIPAIIAAIAGGIAQARALSSGFYEGTEYVKGKPGRDKIPAMLTRGEGVIKEPINRQLKGVPHEVLPEAVKMYYALQNLNSPKETYSEKELRSFNTLDRQTVTNIYHIMEGYSALQGLRSPKDTHSEKEVRSFKTLERQTVTSIYRMMEGLPQLKQDRYKAPKTQDITELKTELKLMRRSLEAMGKMYLSVDSMGIRSGIGEIDRKIRETETLLQ